MATESTFESLSPSFLWPELSTPEPSAQPNSFETLIPARPEHSPAEHSSTDVDSAYAESPEDATESLSLSMLDYRFEHGRRYHAWHDGAYWGPNDEQAQKLQDIAHRMYYITFDERLFLAPVVNPQAILDVGTGTGIWAIDVADEFPAARATGLDLSPIQPTLVPPSCSFEIDDVTMPWTYESEQFDLIYVREMFGSIPDWNAFFRQCWASLRPGGYIEVVEHSVTPIWDDDTSLDLIYASWGQTIAQIEQVSGKSFSIWRESAQLLEGSGFQDITRRSYKWPISGWSKDPRLRELGRLNQVRLLQAVEDIFLRHLTTTMAWPLDEVQAFIEQIRSTISDEQRLLYQPVTVVYGQKSRHNSELL